MGLAHAIDIIDGRGLSNEAHSALLLKKSKVRNAVIAFIFPFNQLYITNKMERFSFKSRHDVRVSKFIK